jgi:hypothetical protein
MFNFIVFKYGGDSFSPIFRALQLIYIGGKSIINKTFFAKLSELSLAVGDRDGKLKRHFLPQNPIAPGMQDLFGMTKHKSQLENNQKSSLTE